MRVKISITLPKELVRQLDRVKLNRSVLLELAAKSYLALLERRKKGRNDIAIINRNASRLNRQAKDTLDYQRIF